MPAATCRQLTARRNIPAKLREGQTIPLYCARDLTESVDRECKQIQDKPADKLPLSFEQKNDDLNSHELINLPTAVVFEPVGHTQRQG